MVPLLTNVWVVFSCGLLQAEPLLALSLHGRLFSFLSGQYLGVVGPYSKLMFIFLRNCQAVSQNVRRCDPHQPCRGFRFLHILTILGVVRLYVLAMTCIGKVFFLSLQFVLPFIALSYLTALADISRMTFSTSVESRHFCLIFSYRRKVSRLS